MSADSPDQPRVAPLQPDEWGEAEYAAFGAMLRMPGEQVPRAGSGHKYDPLRFSVVGTMVRHPELARAFWKFNGYQLSNNSLPLRWRELSILRVANHRRSAYEWGQHVKIALEGGVTQAELDQLARGNAGFLGSDLLILEATDQLLTTGHIGGEVWLQLQAELSEHQAMDLIFLVGTYSMLAMAFETWGLQPEPDTAPLPSGRTPTP